MYYNKDKAETLKLLDASESGLTSRQVEERLSKYGKNELKEKEKDGILKKIWNQVKDPMIIILIIAAFLSLIEGAEGAVDFFIIIGVVVINTVIGLVQENKAEKAVEALKNMSASKAKVFRDGNVVMVNSSELVPGDVVALDAGDMIPADLRLIESSNVKIEEASLTGESVPSEKDADLVLDEAAPIGDRKNMAFYGTSMTYGRAKGLVCATAMHTEMGKIADIINNAEDEMTPLQKKLAEISKLLTILILGISVVMFTAMIIKSGGFSRHVAIDAFMISISLAVAAIPEGLPAVVTIIMSAGVTLMAKHKAVIKKMPAVETLGCTEIICSDKTGTLTMNKMTVKGIYENGEFLTAEKYLEKHKESGLSYKVLYLCNDSNISENGEEIGDPTETCLKRFVEKRFKKNDFDSFERVKDLPFDSERKMMSTVNNVDGKTYVFTKGAPDELIKRCSKITVGGKVTELMEEHKKQITAANADMAHKALRVLAAAYKEYNGEENEHLEENLIFTSLIGMIDPPREEVFEAIKKCKTAGITPVMITGDHRDTAVAIGKEIGILEDESQAIFGSELDNLSDEEFLKIIEGIRVYARVSPQHKVRIVEMWKKKNKVVAMTGDGVNDAPALKISDIGVGMGITGSDVSKSVSDMLLSDDNFATIVNAVEEGRKIYTNIRKAVQFLLASNLSEVLSIFTATMFFAIPAGEHFLSPVHILWINLVTDSLPAIALGVDKSEAGIMNEQPRDSKKSFFADGLGINIAFQGVFLAILTLAAYLIGSKTNPLTGTTMAFLTLSSSQLFHSYNMKTIKKSVFTRNLFDNMALIGAALLPMTLNVLLVKVPFLNDIFHVTDLNMNQLLIVLALSCAIIPLVEIGKFIVRLTDKKHG